MNDRQMINQRSRLTLDDVYYVLFKHKWKIIGCSAAGLLGAVAMLVFWPPMYESEAKVFIRYVLDSKSPSTTPDDSRVIATAEGQNIISSEIEILTSLDLAEQVVDVVGPERILAKSGGGKDRFAAANLIQRNLVIDVPNKSSVMRVVFRHPDPQVVQPVLTVLIDDYLRKHAEIHQAFGQVDDSLTQETDQLRAQLTQTEQELRQARSKINVISLEDSKKDYTDQIAKIRQEIFDAEAELAERQAALGEQVTPASALSVTNAVGIGAGALPVDEYRSITARIDELWKKHKELIAQFTEKNKLVKDVRVQISEAELAKKSLEEKYPALALTASASKSNEPQSGAAVEQKTMIAALQTKIRVLNDQLQQIRKETGAIDEMDSTISDLQRKKQLEESNYRYFSSSLEQARIDEAISHGKITNISKIQEPSPPFKVPLETTKRMAMVFVGSVVGGLAWAFLTELFLDRSVKRPIEVQTKLRLPLFLSIPDVERNGHRRLAKAASQERPALKAAGEGGPPATAVGAAEAEGSQMMELKGPKRLLRPFHEALRDRLAMYFETRGITHKPKLVAVTSTDHGTGVTTTAAGLAACLSETGDGNVLLVDMNLEKGAAHRFRNGDPVLGLEDALYNKDTTMVQDNLYVVTETEKSNTDRLPRILPKRFSQLVPKLKASDYDYIIFDMPPITQTSLTPRLAGFMDMVLLVIESEKTDRQVVQQASALLAESKANVCAVLNKTRTYVPARLNQEYLSDS
jgi:uncharacterized protein involved in exopolysaccharide biosynthesis/Mrp family chromosome partitioning ATPase